MRTLFLIFLLQAGLFSFAQDRCASSDYIEVQNNSYPLAAQRIAEAERFLQTHSGLSLAHARTSLEQQQVIRIPVVVHVVYKNATENISDAQVQSQIDALNRDFRKKNTDTANTPERFRHLAADIKIEFYLATADPAGRPTSGIVRRRTDILNFYNNDKMKFTSLGGSDAWDSKSYLNIWVCKLISGAGYATVPGSDATKDGIVISSAAFGTVNVGGNYNMGRTAAHEIGHWLGLKHIWGDTQCGDDGIADTPQQGWYTQNCPSGFRSSCNNGDAGDMYMNYMDYTADACTNMFTLGQAAKMRAAFVTGGPRESLLKSKGLSAPWTAAASDKATAVLFSFYPNPANNELNVKVEQELIGKTITIMNLNGTVMQAIPLKSGIQKLNLSSLKAGMYLLKVDGQSQKFIRL